VLNDQDKANKALAELRAEQFTPRDLHEANDQLRTILGEMTAARLEINFTGMRRQQSLESTCESCPHEHDSEDLNRRLSEVLEYRKELEAQVEDAEAQVAQEAIQRVYAQQQLQQLQDRHNGLLKINKAVTNEVNQLRRRLLLITSYEGSESSTDLGEMQKELKQAVEQIDSMEKQLYQAQDEMDSTRPRLQELERTCANQATDIERLSAQLDNTSDVNKSFRSQMDAARTQLATAKAEVARLARRQSVIMSGSSSQSKDSQSKDSIMDVPAEWVVKVDGLTEELHLERRQTSALQVQLLELKADLAENQTLREKVKMQARHVAELSSVLDDARQAAREAQQELRALTEELNEERRNTDVMSAQLAEHVAASARLLNERDEDIVALSAKLSIAEEALQEQEAQHSSIAQQQGDSTVLIDQLQADRDMALTDLEKAHTSLSTLQSVAARLQAEFDAEANNTRQRYESEIDRLRSQCKTLKDSVAVRSIPVPSGSIDFIHLSCRN
jgi:chromosome segregation ATPase